ncbi:hypothetical protein BRD15_04420 [Halobacteriales archaeon SW_6_65_15]|nr:MAG: hypothetical protein BRD15_04420 [Halobacteriales archaeon SW_6_65_15]
MRGAGRLRPRKRRRRARPRDAPPAVRRSRNQRRESAGTGYGGLEGYVVGGSDLLDLTQLPREVSENNVAAARETFADLDVAVEGTAVGGSRGRTVEFDTATGEVRVITAHDAEPTLLRTADD